MFSSLEAHTFEIVSGDGKAFKLTEGMIDQSDMLMGVDRGTKKLKVTGTNGKCMRLVVQWLEHHQGDTPAQKQARGVSFSRLPNWDATFLLRQDSETMNGMYTIASALELTRLMEYMNTMRG